MVSVPFLTKIRGFQFFISQLNEIILFVHKIWLHETCMWWTMCFSHLYNMCQQTCIKENHSAPNRLGQNTRLQLFGYTPTLWFILPNFYWLNFYDFKWMNHSQGAKMTHEFSLTQNLGCKKAESIPPNSSHLCKWGNILGECTIKHCREPFFLLLPQWNPKKKFRCFSKAWERQEFRKNIEMGIWKKIWDYILKPGFCHPSQAHWIN